VNHRRLLSAKLNQFKYREWHPDASINGENKANEKENSCVHQHNNIKTVSFVFRCKFSGVFCLSVYINRTVSGFGFRALVSNILSINYNNCITVLVSAIPSRPCTSNICVREQTRNMWG
jgi:hypothetical protein